MPRRQNGGRTGKAPLIPNLGIRQRWVINCMPWSLYQLETAPVLCGPQGWTGCSRDEKNLSHLPDSNPVLSGPWRSHYTDSTILATAILAISS